eukprot:365474-Chlamydomonas_euryale.AAC.9
MVLSSRSVRPSPAITGAGDRAGATGTGTGAEAAAAGSALLGAPTMEAFALEAALNIAQRKGSGDKVIKIGHAGVPKRKLPLRRDSGRRGSGNGAVLPPAPCTRPC